MTDFNYMNEHMAAEEAAGRPIEVKINVEIEVDDEVVLDSFWLSLDGLEEDWRKLYRPIVEKLEKIEQENESEE